MLRTSAAFALAIMAMGTIGVAAQDRHVRINNNTSYDIIEFYASNKGSRSWEEDVLGRNILPAGSSVVINIDDGSGYCKYDFLAVFEDGEELTKYDNNVCELSQFSYTD